jgi:hypothetical protein
MPRAQLDKHFARDHEFRQALIRRPEARRISREINHKVRENGAISAGELSSLINVPRSSLHEQRIVSVRKKSRVSPLMFTGKQARVLLTRYLPRALGWKSTQDCAKEYTLHRNHIEKIVRDRGKEGDLLVAEDKRWYVSPQGEKLVRQAVLELETFADHLSPRQLADRCKVGLNLVTSYFSSRGVKIARDLLGHARISPEQVREFDEWRIKVALREELPDKRIDGVTYRALKRAAAERAELLAPREDARHEIVVRKCEDALRHICNQAEVLEQTELGPYLPQEMSESYRARISVPDAARILGVAATTIKLWRSRLQRLQPPLLPGRYALDVNLLPLVEYAAKKYLVEPSLRKRKFVPARIAYFQIRALAEQLHVDWRGLMESVIPSEKVRQHLFEKSSKLSLSAFAEVQDQIAEYKHYALRGNRHEKPAAKHYSTLARVLELDALVVPSEQIIQLLKSCEAERGHNADYLYNLARSLCRKPGLYPPDLTSLYRCKQLNTRISSFPLMAAVFLETARSTPGTCHNRMGLPQRVFKGDLVVDPSERDFGVIEVVGRRFGETVATIAMRGSQKHFEVHLALQI